ncbi:MAG: DNA-formamidopyrimidine glycosylase [Synechococcales bacterium]|nr:DNA-formamidopyrimidine glycosylase [Synechococcales bacterium]
MPELPEVETVRRGLNQTTLEQPIAAGEILLARTIAFPSPADFLAGLVGCELVEWQRRGKYLLGQLRRQGQPAGYWVVHLRMTGQMLWVSPESPVEKHARVRLFFHTQTAHRQELRYVDQRTFGQMWWVPADRSPADIVHGLGKLGPEPFDAEFSEDYLLHWCCDRHRPIKNALLDQSLVAGVGNIYADEALFLSQIHPKTYCSMLTRSQVSTLRQRIIQVLEISIAAKGTTLRDYRTVEGVNGNYGGQAWVYGRDGTPCHVCGTTIERIKLAGRSAHFCPVCQLGG